jgi:hypothetical protein
MHIQFNGDLEVSLKGYIALPYNETMKLESAKTADREMGSVKFYGWNVYRKLTATYCPDENNNRSQIQH